MDKKKVMVGMSGGVDSSVAAAILVEKGYDVIGVTIQLWPDETKGSEEGCCSLSAVYDARRVADKLGIPYYVLNFRDEFKKRVIDYFIREYSCGRTPNPCIACNRYIKFGLMLDKAASMGMDHIATGHYARAGYDPGTGRYLLKRSAAGEKDQTYVLYSLTQRQLGMTIFPLGEFAKGQTRKKAKEFGLQVADKRESQEICFIPDNDYVRFLEENVPGISKPGNFIDTQGNMIGRHKGIVHYTIGQRRGLEIAFGKRMFVSDIDVRNNTVTLGEEKDLYSNTLTAADVNFIPFDSLNGELRVTAKIRYNSEDSPATITPGENGEVNVVFDVPQRAVAPGQSVVFYDGDTVVGGGIIKKEENKT